MPRSFLFVLAVTIWAYHVAEAAKMEKVACACTKPPSNAVKKKSAHCVPTAGGTYYTRTYYTACCQRAHPSMDCTFSPATTLKKAGAKGSKNPGVLGNAAGKPLSCSSNAECGANYFCLAGNCVINRY